MLELRGLRRAYGDVCALDDLTFTVPAGTVFGFLGPNGAGKTTAMRVVMGIVEPDRGEARWSGRRIRPEDRHRFGYLPEERGLYPTMVVIDQLVYLARLHGMTASAARESAMTWLDLLGISGRADDKLDSLSLGNQQRVQLAAALVHGPDLLVLDEPFSGLDPVGIDALAAVLEARATAGATVLFSSHQLDLVEHLCEEVAIIDGGRLVVQGKVGDLTAPDGRLLVVEVGGAGTAWAHSLKGVEVKDIDDDRVRIELFDGANPETVLRAARRAGPLRHFSYEGKRLSEVFLQAVAK